MPEITPTRRSIIRTAAWSVPAITVASAAPAFASSGADPTYQSVTETFTYEARLGGESGPAIGDITVEVTATVPATAPRGATLNPTTTQSTVTIPASLADLLKSVYLPGATSVTGTSVSTSVLSGTLPGTTVANLTIPSTPLPPDGQPLVTVASGSSAAGLPVPVDTPLGTTFITMGQPNSVLTGDNGTVYESVLFKKPGTTDADYQLATFEVIA